MPKEVGNFNKKVVSYENAALYKKATEILENNQNMSHIGWEGVGKLIDYVDAMYELSPKDYTMKDFEPVDRTLQEDVGIVTAKAQGHLCQILMEEKESIEDEVTGKHYHILKVIFDEDLFKEEGHHKIVMSEIR